MTPSSAPISGLVQSGSVQSGSTWPEPPLRAVVCVPSLSPHDAVSNDVLGMYEALHKRGFDVRLLPSDHALALGLTVIGPEDVAAFLSRPQDLFIYHYAVHWPLAESLLQHLTCRRIIKYHNITPAEFFIDIDIMRPAMSVANLCRASPNWPMRYGAIRSIICATLSSRVLRQSACAL